MKAWLGKLEADNWAALRELPVERWLWLDTRPPGVHHETDLPEEPPQTTHVWGWTADWAVRARVDVDLPGLGVGVVGALLAWSGTPPQGALEVEAAESIRPVWARDHGRSSIREVPGLVGPGGSIDLLTLDVHRELRDGGTTTLVPLTFLRG